jgi:hypothetical protein
MLYVFMFYVMFSTKDNAARHKRKLNSVGRGRKLQFLCHICFYVMFLCNMFLCFMLCLAQRITPRGARGS